MIWPEKPMMLDTSYVGAGAVFTCGRSTSVFTFTMVEKTDRTELTNGTINRGSIDEGFSATAVIHITPVEVKADQAASSIRLFAIWFSETTRSAAPIAIAAA